MDKSFVPPPPEEPVKRHHMLTFALGLVGAILGLCLGMYVWGMDNKYTYLAMLAGLVFGTTASSAKIRPQVLWTSRTTEKSAFFSTKSNDID